MVMPAYAKNRTTRNPESSPPYYSSRTYTAKQNKYTQRVHQPTHRREQPGTAHISQQLMPNKCYQNVIANIVVSWL